MTIAGNGRATYTGDGGPATSASLFYPSAVALDNAGNIYIADNQNNVVRMLTPNPDAQAAPTIGSGGVITATAFGGFKSIAPGSWIEIYGSALAARSRSWGTADFNGPAAPTLLDGTTVSIGGQDAFVAYISEGQVNVQAPSAVAPGQQQVKVSTVAGSSNTFTITVNATQPGLLAPSSFNLAGKQYATAQFPDGAYVLPSGAIPTVPSRPARPGDTITLYGVGFGPVTPDIPAGQIAQKTNALASQLQVFFGSAQAILSYAGLAPNSVGLYQFNVVVPNVAASDTVPLTFVLAGTNSTQTLFVAVQNP